MEFKVSDNKFWYQIEEVFKNKGGVYELFCKNNDDVIPVNRLLKEDVLGRLYIGKANYFLDRVIELKKSLSPNHASSGHECGVRWKEPLIQEKFPYDKLWIRLEYSEDPRFLETKKLEDYRKEYGELPPLNRNI